MGCCITRAVIAESVTMVVRRQTASSYTAKGRWTTPAETTISIDGAVQPMTPKEILREVDSRHVKAAIKVYSEDPFIMADEATKVQPDVIVYNGEDYEVYAVSDWDCFYKTVAVRMEA